MQCPQCRHENPPSVKFCHDCGTALARRCPSCQTELAPAVKFCGECGAPVVGSRQTAVGSSPPPPLTPISQPLTPAKPALAPPRPRNRLAAVDWLLISTLLPICLFGVVMSVVHGIRGDFARPPFFATWANDGHSYPTVNRVFPLPSGEAGPLAVGDRLVRLEGEDLGGVSLIGYLLRRSKLTLTGHSMLVTIERGGVRSEVRVPFVPGYQLPGFPWWVVLPFVLALVGTALLLLVRATHWHLARRFYVGGLLVAMTITPYFGVPTAPWASFAIDLLVGPLAFGLTAWNLFEFIPGLRLWGPWQRALTWALALLLSTSRAAGYWLPDAGMAALLRRSQGVANLGFLIAWLVALTLQYRRAEPLGRRQVKWVVYGFYLGLLPWGAYIAVDWGAYIAMDWLGVLPQWEGALFVVAMIAALAIPLGILVAVAFYDFLDIDRLFSATLSYSLLAIAGIAIVLGVMPTASRAASEALGLDSGSGQLLLALGFAAIVVPAQRVVRPLIDRLLFPQRLALEQGFEQLLTEISSCADTQGLTRLVGERLDALLHPVAAVVYARAGDVFTPMAVRGGTAAPAFAAQSALIAALQGRTAPLAAERWTARRSISLTPFERAAIETLDVAVLVPFRRGTDLVAFSCLGPKRSGDVYTPTDLAWLGAIAGKISDRLLSLDATAVTEQARAMQEALRRYVPGAVAERLASGKDVEAGEREVTVLFVDIRGYTGFSEPRQAEEIFHTVNRYTEMVSRLVQARGGVVVEFTGDGMMAVFGAPDEVPMKERAAVQVAREIVAAMAELPAPAASPRAMLSVGVGIGTGPAFVGNIQSSDRFIWTVIGNTVNLAARLQSMTRELDAAVAIDDTTFRRAGRETCAEFVRHADLSIRGRAQPETVHALPL
jgi:class 3 adenylate cyclase